ncbi:sensor domain-containing diguanylate cyclase [Vibrio mangrovi]|uniref:diguanylate cyclase n=1 Tax=Vibrio mangrovi TaxID=474394 RepID=A0A1Y6IPW1_9VIBR|nr:sensor domain-containing diguanylate cyclase [Vibrio mangrovi]MDW6004091.1 sensor domain-containing diguanylate cyclase [Vibrio mangrovi]SMR99111.1 putative diguanylate cyclase YcdT [Vibrio mangrovi]
MSTTWLTCLLNEKGELVSSNQRHEDALSLENFTSWFFNSPSSLQPLQSRDFNSLLLSQEEPVELSILIQEELWGGSLMRMHPIDGDFPEAIFLSLHNIAKSPVQILDEANVRLMQKQMMQLESDLHYLVDIIPGVIYQYERRSDGHACFPYISPQVETLLGVKPEVVAQDATTLLQAVHPDDRQRVYHSVLRAEASQNEWECEFRVIHQGKICWLYGHSVPVHNDQHRQLWSGLMIDISDKKTLELKLQRESTIDPLTNVFNRRYFMYSLNRTFTSGFKNKDCVSILAIDFDHFKKVNDQYGHDAGDEVLKQVTSAIKRHIRRSDILARMGGEEFSVILPSTEYKDAVKIAEKLRKCVENTAVHYLDSAIRITITIGVASAENSDLNEKDLLRRADRALYRGKAAGRNLVM